jgi:excisionase family DNA binding protein
MTTDEKMVLTIEEAGKALGVSRATAYKLAKNGQLPGVIRLGFKIFVSKLALTKFLENAGCQYTGKYLENTSTVN